MTPGGPPISEMPAVPTPPHHTTADGKAEGESRQEPRAWSVEILLRHWQPHIFMPNNVCGGTVMAQRWYKLIVGPRTRPDSEGALTLTLQLPF